jgi:hypothetical protein
MLGWYEYRFDKKCAGTRCMELVFLHQVGYMGHVGHSSASGECNDDALFFMLGWNRYRFNKNRAERCYAKLVFLQLVGYAGHVVHSSVSG